jgi:hypothetical protein
MLKESRRRLACHEGACVTESDAVFSNEQHLTFKHSTKTPEGPQHNQMRLPLRKPALSGQRLRGASRCATRKFVWSLRQVEQSKVALDCGVTNVIAMRPCTCRNGHSSLIRNRSRKSLWRVEASVFGCLGHF